MSEAKKNTNWKIEVESPMEAERLIKGKHITLGGMQVEVEPFGIGYMKKPSFANVLAGGAAAITTPRKMVQGGWTSAPRKLLPLGTVTIAKAGRGYNCQEIG